MSTRSVSFRTEPDEEAQPALVLDDVKTLLPKLREMVLVPRVLSWFTVGWLGSLGYGESTSPAIGLT